MFKFDAVLKYLSMLGALIGAGISIAASTIGSAIANKRKREAEEAYRKGVEAEIAEIDKEIGANYLDGATARNTIRRVTDANTEALRQLNTDAIRGGATDEAKVAMASKLNKGTADVVGELSAMGEERKEKLKAEKRGLRRGLLQHQYDVNADTSGMDTIVQGIGSAASTLGSAWGGRQTLQDQVKDFAKDMAITQPTPATSGQKIYGADDKEAIEYLKQNIKIG